MAIQDFTAGQVLTAAQMDSLQANDYNWTVSTKTASYTLAATDKGTRIAMNSASATTITVNTNIFAAGDILWIQNINSGTCTITAGTCTVNTAGSLALAQWQGGTLYFTSASTAIFFLAGSGSSYGTATGGTSSSITVSGVAYTLLTFTTDANLVVSKAGLFDFCGAGGGGAGGVGGGGGALMQPFTMYLDAATYAITIGTGGAAGTHVQGGFGGNPTKIGTAFAICGGGPGGNDNINLGIRAGYPGQCGGGGLGTGAGGKGARFDGGTPTTNAIGAGGGGGGANGSANVSTVGGAGGAGYDVQTFTGAGSSNVLGGGGGGAGSGGGGSGGSGGGGNGATGGTGTNATASKGAGGGGGGAGSPYGTGGTGSSGFLYVRFKV